MPVDVDDIRNKILYLAATSEKSLKKAVQNKTILKLFESDEMSFIAISEFMKWYNDYKEMPSLRKIDEANKANAHAAKLHIKLKLISDISKALSPPTENEFDSYINDLKIQWMKEKFEENLNRYTGIDGSNGDINNFSKAIKDYGSQFLKITDSIILSDDGEYSLTTQNVASNIELIKNRDISNEKRFKIGHRRLDNETNGFRYGDLVMILGNINQGKSMVVSNIVYNLWREKANVLLLTAEHKPFEFDERIYSRATNVDYKAIMNGKDFLNDADRAALDECVRVMANTPHKIITKFLRSSDNVGTIAGYIDDLKLKYDFIPDVIVVDSLEKISPLSTIIEDKDHLQVGGIIKEFKGFAQTFMNNRGLVIISTHQAKTETFDKDFDEISPKDFGRSKVVAEEPDFALYIRSKTEFNTMNVKLIKARRTTAGLCWTMAIDFSKVLVTDTEDDTNSEMLPDD